MIAADWLLRSFYVYLRSYGHRGLRASIILASIPVALNITSLIIFLMYLVAPELLFKGGFIGLFILTLLSYFVVETYLEDHFMKKKRPMGTMHSPLLYVFSPLYYIVSVWVLIVFFRFL